MRNIGRKGCGTDWTYSADVDIVPRKGMADMLQQFYTDWKSQENRCTKCGYIIPAFELSDNVPFPQSKKEISKLFKEGKANQYNVKVYSSAQAATDYKRWTSSKMEDGFVSISHDVNHRNTKNYEPFYLSPDNISPFDERFLGYGFTRSSQFKAAIAAGWNFSVLTPVYSIHWGLQTRKTYVVPKKGGVGKPVREQQNQKNSKVYSMFVKELEFKKKIGFL